MKVIWLPNECVFWEIPLNSIPWETKVKINKWCLKIVYFEKKDLEIKMSYFAFGLFLWLSVRFLRHFWKPFLGIWISSFTLTIFLLETRRTSQFETPFQIKAPRMMMIIMITVMIMMILIIMIITIIIIIIILITILITILIIIIEYMKVIYLNCG